MSNFNQLLMEAVQASNLKEVSKLLKTVQISIILTQLSFVCFYRLFQPDKNYQRQIDTRICF
ncbi:MAG: hypothetical protein V4683_17805 [Bacteroidota bacterium]